MEYKLYGYSTKVKLKERLSNIAKKIKKKEGLKFSRALDKASTLYGFTNFQNFLNTENVGTKTTEELNSLEE